MDLTADMLGQPMVEAEAAAEPIGGHREETLKVCIKEASRIPKAPPARPRNALSASLDKTNQDIRPSNVAKNPLVRALPSG